MIHVPGRGGEEGYVAIPTVTNTSNLMYHPDG